MIHGMGPPVLMYRAVGEVVARVVPLVDGLHVQIGMTEIIAQT